MTDERFDTALGHILDDERKPSFLGEDSPSHDGSIGSPIRPLVLRLLFLRFVQERGWLDGNRTYLQDRYDAVRSDGAHPGVELFGPVFAALGTPGTTESDEYGRLPHLGGPFEVYGGEMQASSPVDPADASAEFYDGLLAPSDGGGLNSGLLRRYEFGIENPDRGCNRVFSQRDSTDDTVVTPGRVIRAFERASGDAERAMKGAFYTPPSVATYVVRLALVRYLENVTGADENDAMGLLTDARVPEDPALRDECLTVLREARLLDPAAGGGAFAVAALDALVSAIAALRRARDDPVNRYAIARKTLAHSLYGVDLDPAGIDLCTFSLQLHALSYVEETPDGDDADKVSSETVPFPDPLPHLDRSFLVGNALVGDHDPTQSTSVKPDVVDHIARLRREYPLAYGRRRHTIIQKLRDATSELAGSLDRDAGMAALADRVDDPFEWRRRMPEVICRGGFDIVVGNPPYEGRSKHGYEGDLSELYEQRHDFYERIPGMRPDRYQQFVVRGWELTRRDGILAYITSDTFLTIRSKRPIRVLLQREDLTDLVRLGDVFDATVNPAVFALHVGGDPGRFTYIDARSADVANYANLIRASNTAEREDGDSSPTEDGPDGVDVYRPRVARYRRNLGRTFFAPTLPNRHLHREYLRPAQSLTEEWEEALRNARSLARHRASIEEKHLARLNPGDITLVGLVTTGGVGIQVPRNDDHLAYVAGSEPARKIRDQNNVFHYVKRNENPYRRMSRVITSEHIADAGTLTPAERRNGIEGERDDSVWVPIEKGIGGAFYRGPITFIDWRCEAVTTYREHPDAYLRNLDHYFAEGIFAAGQGNGDPEFRYTNNRVIDHSGNILVPIADCVSVEYLLGVLCSSISSHLIEEFVNHSVNTQLSDFRHLPVPVPTSQERRRIERIVERAMAARRAGEDITDISLGLDTTVADLYGLDSTSVN